MRAAEEGVEALISHNRLMPGHLDEGGPICA